MERTPQAYAHGILAAVLEPWVDGLGKVGDALRHDGKLRARLDDAALDPEARMALLQALAPTGAPAELGNFLGVLTAHGDLRLLDEVQATLASVITAETAGPLAATVTSAVPLAADEQSKLAAQLATQFGANLNIDFRVDADILGGLVVRVGDKLIDDSVRGRIDALRQSLGVRR